MAAPIISASDVEMDAGGVGGQWLSRVFDGVGLLGRGNGQQGKRQRAIAFMAGGFLDADDQAFAILGGLYRGDDEIVRG